MHEGRLADTIAINTGVRQQCIFLCHVNISQPYRPPWPVKGHSFTFTLKVSIKKKELNSCGNGFYIMNKLILGKKRGINWGVSQQLKDLDFADEICLSAQ
jgi:hypothetical protein